VSTALKNTGNEGKNDGLKMKPSMTNEIMTRILNVFSPKSRYYNLKRNYSFKLINTLVCKF